MAQQTIEWEPEALAMLELVPPAWDLDQRVWRRERIAERARQQGHTEVKVAIVEELLKEVSHWGWGGALFQYDRSEVPWWSPFGEEFDPERILAELHGQAPAATEHAVDFYVEVLGLQPGARLLDLGCGFGRAVVPLARRGFVVTGIDQWSSGLAVARAWARENSVEVTFVEADYCRPPYDGLGDRDAAFDAVISLGSMFVQSPRSDQEARSLMVELNRLLKPGGYLFVNDIPNPASPRWSQEPNDLQIVQELGGGAFVLVEHRRRGEDGFHRLIRIEPGQAPREFRTTTRRYTPPQVIALMNDAGLTVRRRWSHNWDDTVSELAYMEHKETDDLPPSDGVAFLVQKEA